VLGELHALFPGAPIYTSVHDPGGLAGQARSWPVRTTWLQRLHVPARYSRGLLPLMPGAFAALDMRGFDIVLTMSSAFSKNIRVAAGARNICYCLTPPRYLWDLHDAYLRSAPARAMTAPLTAWLRKKDLEASRRVDEFVAISRTVAARVRATYGREASVIYPPVDTARLATVEPRPAGYFLVVSRLIRYKRIDLAIAACNRLGRRLIIVGAGPLRGELERGAGPTIEFVGQRTDAQIAELLAGCDALLFPGLEDFGITPVEAQAAGRPVVAFGKGGATETVVDGVTGAFFAEQSAESLVDALERLATLRIEPGRCRENARRFDASVFRREMVAMLTHQAGGFHGTRAP
jgi:glycosyltransferase involved in cell wall biosynthesis